MKISDITFTKAQPAQADEIFAIYRAAAAHLSEIGIDQWDELYPAMQDVTEDITRRQMFIGTAGGRIVCAFTINQEYDEAYLDGSWQHPDEPFCIVHRLCVHPDFQHCGIGRLAMEHIERIAFQYGCTAIRLDTFTKNPYSIRLYESLGYRTAGYADWRKGRFVLMEKYISFDHPEAI